MPTFRKVGEREVYDGPVIRLVVATFAGPDGETFERDVVHHPGAVSVVPLSDDGEVVMVRQYRAAVDADVLEIPAGKRDVPGEAPEVHDLATAVQALFGLEIEGEGEAAAAVASEGVPARAHTT